MNPDPANDMVGKTITLFDRPTWSLLEFRVFEVIHNEDRMEYDIVGEDIRDELICLDEEEFCRLAKTGRLAIERLWHGRSHTQELRILGNS